MSRRGGWGYIEIPLWEGIYPYGFMDEHYRLYLDTEAPETVEVDLDGYSFHLSKASIGGEILQAALEEGGLHPEHIIHDERFPGFAHHYLGYLILRLSTLKGEVEEVYIEIKGNDGVKRYAAEKVFSDKFRDYFEGVLKENPLPYRFLLKSSGKLLSYGFHGAGDETFFPPPSCISKDRWWIGSTYYLIFPDSFSGLPDKSLQLNSYTRPRRRLGGTLKGIIEKLPYISGLGFDAIYLTPIYEAASYHRYDVVDHLEVDPSLGTKEEFMQLVKEAERKGMHVVLDLVAHHTSPCFEFFRDCINKGRHSPHWEFYRFLVNDVAEVDEEILKRLNEFIQGGCRFPHKHFSSELPFYETFANNWGMAKVNHYSRDVKKYFIEVLSFWTRFGVGGFRVDVGNALPDSFLEFLYRSLKTMSEDKVLIIETNYGIDQYLLGKIADSAMNYDLRNLVIDFFIRKRINAYTLAQSLMKIYWKFPLYVSNSLYNLLGSHDTPRIIEYSKELDDLINAYAFLYVVYGSPSIYYGDEVGLRGGKDPDNRRPMEWDRSKWNMRIYTAIKRLNLLRKRNEALRKGFFRAMVLDDDSLMIVRVWRNSSVIGYFTRGMLEVSLSPKMYSLWKDSEVEGILKLNNSFDILVASKQLS